MLQRLLDALRFVANVTSEIQRLKDQNEEIQAEVRALQQALNDLTTEVRTQHIHDVHERENLMLRLENELLKFERRLPPPPPSRRQDSK